MTTSSQRGCELESAKLSGYIDGALTQGDHQLVSRHLQQCESCRQVVSGMREIREAAMTTAFVPVSDDQWSETPRGRVSLWARNFGWALLAVWFLATLALLLWMPDRVESEWLERGLIWGCVAAWGALFLSVLLDRLKTMKGDVYRGVER